MPLVHVLFTGYFSKFKTNYFKFCVLKNGVVFFSKFIRKFTNEINGLPLTFMKILFYCYVKISLKL